MSPGDAPNPLNGTHYDIANESLNRLNHARQLVGKMQGTGLDTRVHTELIDRLEQQLGTIKANFFPQGRPRP